MIEQPNHNFRRSVQGRVSGLVHSSSLMGDLRARTAALHTRAEALLGLPDNIADRGTYAAWLGHFLAFYDPLESLLGGFDGWGVLAPFPPESVHSRRLIRDLGALGCDSRTASQGPKAPRPALRTFAQALGARYVIEGATLGGKVILRDLEAKIGPDIAGATAFFGGGDPDPSSTWRVFRSSVDRFGALHPECREDVLTGAEITFRALLDWFEPFVAQEGNHGPSPCCEEGPGKEGPDRPSHPDPEEP